MSEEERWRGRPVVALALRFLIVAVPLVGSAAASLFVARRLPVPLGFAAKALWWCAVLGASVAVILLGELAARRLLPLVALLRLSLLFPGRAPSRLTLARQSSRRELRALIDQVKTQGLGTDTAAAAHLVRLVAVLDAHDRKTSGHSERVRASTDVPGERLSLDEHARDRLRWAALLHDIGKLMVPFDAEAFSRAGLDLGVVYLPQPHTPAVLEPVAQALAHLA